MKDKWDGGYLVKAKNTTDNKQNTTTHYIQTYPWALYSPATLSFWRVVRRSRRAPHPDDFSPTRRACATQSTGIVLTNCTYTYTCTYTCTYTYPNEQHFVYDSWVIEIVAVWADDEVAYFRLWSRTQCVPFGLTNFQNFDIHKVNVQREASHLFFGRTSGWSCGHEQAGLLPLFFPLTPGLNFYFIKNTPGWQIALFVLGLWTSMWMTHTT